MASPSMTFNSQGNLLATNTSVAAGAANSSATWDLSAKFEGQLHAHLHTGATVSATNGLRVDVFALAFGTTYDTTPIASVTFATGLAANSDGYSPPIYLPTGKYQISVTNLDATNAIQADLTGHTIDSVA